MDLRLAGGHLARPLGYSTCRLLFVLTLNGLPCFYHNSQAESLKYKLLGGLAVRRACYGVLRFIMESGAKGAEVGRRIDVLRLATLGIRCCKDKS